MRKIQPLGAALLVIIGSISGLALAAGLDVTADSPYRLGIDHGAFRLAAEAPLSPPDEHLTSAAMVGKPYAAMIQNAALEAGLEPALIHAVIAVESGYNPAARSPKGAIGLMQLMPATALRYGIRDPAGSPEDNLRAGTLYLKDLMRQFNSRLELVLAAYNAGENAVLRHGERIPPYPETRRYVPAVLARYLELREQRHLQSREKREASRFEYLSGTRLELRGRGYRQ